MPDSPHPNMQDIDITASGVHALLSKINPQKAAGPNDISAWVLKETAYVITPVLKICLNNLWRRAQAWKSAHVFPVHKKEKSLTHKIILQCC